LKRARDCGLRPIATPLLFDEMMEHIAWASLHVEQYGPQSVEILAAALGRGHYRRNEFLDGFIRYSADIKEISFEEYLAECFGGAPQPKQIRKKLVEISVEPFNPNRIAEKDYNFHTMKEKVARFAVEKSALPPETRKSVSRAEAEAEAYSVICLWQNLRPRDIAEVDWKCSFLSQGTFLNRIAHEGPFPLGHNVTQRPDVLYEFLGRLEIGGKPSVEFKDVLLSTYFRAADYFIDKSKYARFFGPLLQHAEKIYAGSLEHFRRLVDSHLTAESLSEFEELERPFVVSGLTDKADEVLRGEVNRLSEENYALRKAKEAAEREIQKLQASRSGRRQKRMRKR